MAANRPLRILLVGPVPPPMGGIVRYAQDIIGSKLAEQHDITLFRDNIPPQYRPSVSTAAKTWNIINRDGLLSTIKVFTFVANRIITLERTLRYGNFDIVHVLSTAGYGFFRNALHIEIAKRQGVKTIFHLLGQIDDLYREGIPLIKRMVSFCLNIADVHIVQSPLLAEFVLNITRRPVCSIFNGVNTQELMAPDGYAHSSGDEIKVLTVGMLGHRKGTFDILEAARKVKDKIPGIKFIFVGGGEIEKFRKIVCRMSLLDTVLFKGRVDDDTLINLLQTSDIFLLPSYAEGQPIALLEAMAAGLPVISSSVGSIPEVVKEGLNGFIVNPGDIYSIVEHLVTLASNCTLCEQMGRFNIKKAQEQYCVERTMNEIQDVYHKLTYN
jgi:glycosyltransferase involved in cell wall biosynthesis